MMRFFRAISQADAGLAGISLALMALIPLVEILSRPLMGKGIDNAPVVVQHLGLLMAMTGAIAAERFGHLTSLGAVFPRYLGLGQWGASVICGILAWASVQFVQSEISAAQPLAYGVPVWWLEAAMPAGFVLLAFNLGGRCGAS